MSTRELCQGSFPRCSGVNYGLGTGGRVPPRPRGADGSAQIRVSVPALAPASGSAPAQAAVGADPEGTRDRGVPVLPESALAAQPTVAGVADGPARRSTWSRFKTRGISCRSSCIEGKNRGQAPSFMEAQNIP